jgi:hypothetical protein
MENGTWWKKDLRSRSLSFDNKNDAVDYATAVAKTRPSSRIGIRNGMGSLETMLQFEAGKSAEGV